MPRGGRGVPCSRGSPARWPQRGSAPRRRRRPAPRAHPWPTQPPTTVPAPEVATLVHQLPIFPLIESAYIHLDPELHIGLGEETFGEPIIHCRRNMCRPRVVGGLPASPDS